MKEKILVVDDEKEITDLVALYLENEGFHVYKFYDSRKALECAQREEMDLAVLDIMMPEVDGGWSGTVQAYPAEVHLSHYHAYS